jgi:cation-transporting ATPase F
MSSDPARNRPTPSTPAWHALDVDEVAARLGVDPATGLSAQEAAARLERDGPNELTLRRPTPWWLRFLRQFHAPLIYILLVATLVTLLLGEYIDSAVIFGVVLVNSVIGYVEETRAIKAIDALARSMQVRAVVRRGGRRADVDASALVVGDVVFIEAGDKVPADIRLLRAHDLYTDESALTGESTTVHKRADVLGPETPLADRANMAYAGSLVARGTGEGIVVATADATEVGRISELIATAEQLETPLARKIAAFSRMLLWAILSVAAVAFLVGVLRGFTPAEMFMASVALAVGAIPEGLPAAVTIMLAVGVSRMARRNAIIRRLPAVEALGSTTVICSDKTGTLTQNQMTVRRAVVGSGPDAVEYEFGGSGYEPHGTVTRVGAGQSGEVAGASAGLEILLKIGALCNDATLVEPGAPGGVEQVWTIQGDPTEGALVVAAQKVHAVDQWRREYPRVAAIPFESDRQYMATLHRTPHGERWLCVKGSVERVLSMCADSLTDEARTAPLDADSVHRHASDLAGQGLRVLAMAFRRQDAGEDHLRPEDLEAPGGAGLTFAGIQGMLDPPRPEAIRAVADCRRAGIRVKMITGDHARTAASIASMMRIGEPVGDGAGGGIPEVLTGSALAKIGDDDLPARAERVDVFARMTPEQKLRLVRALQRRGHIVAMTGDGVNDAPALRSADIGVAMGIAGTEAAKDAADMVLADDNFASIRDAVVEGRHVYDNLSKFIIWTLPTNGGEALVILASIGIGAQLPILPVQALYINMTTGILLGVPLVFERQDPDIMERPPRDPAMPILTHELIMRTGLVSIVLAVGGLGVFEWELARGASEASARTAAVSVIVVGKIPYLFSARAGIRPFWSVPVFSNMWLWAGIAAMLALQAAFAYLPIMHTLFQSGPMDLQAWSVVLGVTAAVLIIVEVEKAVRGWSRREPGLDPQRR